VSRLLVLCWHNVEGTWCFPSRPGEGLRGFRRQLAAIRRFGTVVPLDDALAALRNGVPLPPRAVALTFDDGYRDNLELAAPELQRLGMPATVFLVPAIVSGELRPWWEELSWALTATTRERLDWEGRRIALDTPARRRLAERTISNELKRRDRLAREAAVRELVATLRPAGASRVDDMFLDAEGCRALMRRGLSIGSHSAHHAILSMESAATQAADLADSRRDLEDLFQTPIATLAYPNGAPGDYDRTTVEAAKLAGYANALTTIRGMNGPTTPPYEIRRLLMYPERGVVPVREIARRAMRKARRTLAPRRVELAEVAS
jgi:peptidoglycan/xylan/chitin deacetylase (PgdA/CDA1 family)